MSLHNKIVSIYPELTDAYELFIQGVIALQNDGGGDYIVKWEHPTLPKPTDEQLED